MPVLSLNAADTTIYNPLSDADTQTVTASLKLGTDECPTDKRLFVWEKWNPNDLVWAVVGAETTLDYDVTVSTDGVSCTVNRSLMLLDEILDITPNFPREYKYTIGSKMQELSIELLQDVAAAFINRNIESRIQYLVNFQTKFETLKTLMRKAGERQWIKGRGRHERASTK